jgi:four helix bundle protein
MGFLYGHERLNAWQKAMDLIVECHRITQQLPSYERFALATQIRRAAVSIAANIAEGCGREGTRDRLRFFAFARASGCELHTLLAVVELLKYVERSELSNSRQLLGDVRRLVSGLQRYLRRRLRPPGRTASH